MDFIAYSGRARCGEHGEPGGTRVGAVQVVKIGGCARMRGSGIGGVRECSSGGQVVEVSRWSWLKPPVSTEGENFCMVILLQILVERAAASTASRVGRAWGRCKSRVP